jgi:hypothetical protein
MLTPGLAYVSETSGDRRDGDAIGHLKLFAQYCRNSQRFR